MRYLFIVLMLVGVVAQADVKFPGVANSSISAGAVLYTRYALAGKVEVADKDTLPSDAYVLGVAERAAASSAAVEVFHRGVLKGVYANMTWGETRYLGDDGGLTLNKPSSPAACVVVGTSLGADELLVDPHPCQ
jgi:hypothetical protein